MKFIPIMAYKPSPIRHLPKIPCGGVLNDEDYGVNGLEFDVQLTLDTVPIMMHDGNIDIRLT